MVTISGGFYLLFGIKARADGGDTDIHNDGDVAGGAADCKQIVPTLLPSHRATSLFIYLFNHLLNQQRILQIL